MHSQATESAVHRDVFEASEQEFRSLLRSLNVHSDVTSFELKTPSHSSSPTRLQWRVDIPESDSESATIPVSESTEMRTRTTVLPTVRSEAATSSLDRAEPRIYAPLEVIAKPAEATEDELDLWNSMEAKQRVLRLMESQQQWYDAAQRAAHEAATLLELCEHHQDQWLSAKTARPQ